MSTANPLPRSLRRRDYIATAGQQVFGPADFLCFDAADIRVRVKAVGGLGFATVESGYTVSLTGANVGFPTISFADGRAEADIVRVESARRHQRITDVTRAAALQTAQFERELDKMSVALMDARRDIDDVGDPPFDIVAAVEQAEGAAGVAEGAAGAAVGSAGVALGAAEAAAQSVVDAAGVLASAVKITPQALTGGEQAQAQGNIGLPAILRANTHGGWLAQASGVQSGSATKAVGLPFATVNWGQVEYDYFPVFNAGTGSRCFVLSGGLPSGNIVLTQPGLYRFEAQIYLAPPAANANLSVYLGLCDLGSDGAGADGGDVSNPRRIANQNIRGGMHPSVALKVDRLVAIPAAGQRYFCFKWYFLDGAGVAANATLQTGATYCWATVERLLLSS